MTPGPPLLSDGQNTPFRGAVSTRLFRDREDNTTVSVDVYGPPLLVEYVIINHDRSNQTYFCTYY